MSAESKPEWFVAGSEIPKKPGAQLVRIPRGIRVFRVTDSLVAESLMDWSDPVQLRIEKREDGTYDLIARRVDV